MACFKPLHAFYTGLKTSKGADLILVKGHEVLNVPCTELLNKKYFGLYDRDFEMINAFSSINPSGFPFVRDNMFYKFKEIPCGHCVGCRLEYSRQWAMRLVDECSSNKGRALFLTLTYDEQHVPLIKFPAFSLGQKMRFEFPPYLVDDLGNYCYTRLDKRDLQLFNKRLRRWLEEHGLPSVRFFACGEYGSNTYRAHYHGIYFGLFFDTFNDFKLWSRNKGSPLWISETLNKIWSKGNVIVGQVDFDSCAYVARYVLKKAGVNHFETGCPASSVYPEFLQMSRRPGIGSSYFDEFHGSLFEFGEKFVKRRNGVFKSAPPKYYVSKEKELYPLDYAKLKASKPDNSLHSLAAYDFQDYVQFKTDFENALEESYKVRQLKALKRNSL